MQTVYFHNNQRRFKIALIKNILLYLLTAPIFFIVFFEECNILSVSIFLLCLIVSITIKGTQFCYLYRDVTSILMADNELVMYYTSHIFFRHKKILPYKQIQLNIPHDTKFDKDYITSIINKRNKYNGRYFLYHDADNEEPIRILSDELLKKGVEVHILP